MKKFILKIVALLLLIVALMTIFDAVYTYVYSHSKARNKTQFVLQLKNKKIDYVFLGSSRVQNHIDTKLVEQLTAKKAINLGTSGAKLDHIYLMLKLIVANNITFEKVFIQVDYNYNFESGSTIVSPETLPYIRSNTIIKDHLNDGQLEFYKNYGIPFYRYAANDYKIGFREFFSTAINKKINQGFYDGFEPRNEKFKDIHFSLPKKIANQNKVLEKITKFCKENNIELIYFCSPFCSQIADSNYIESLKEKEPKLYDFSRVITNDSLFVDCVHLNEKGAEIFTKIVVETCISNKAK